MPACYIAAEATGSWLHAKKLALWVTLLGVLLQSSNVAGNEDIPDTEKGAAGSSFKG